MLEFILSKSVPGSYAIFNGLLFIYYQTIFQPSLGMKPRAARIEITLGLSPPK